MRKERPASDSLPPGALVRFATRPSLTRLLALKVVRDTVALGTTSLSLMVLIGLGVALYVTFAEARANLELSYQRFYAKTHFLSATVLVQEAPPGLVDTCKLIPGVKVAVGRRVKDGAIILRDRLRRRVMGRFIGVPGGGRRPEINDIQIVAGRYLANRGEVMVEQKFAEANQVGPGSLITGSYLGQRRDFMVVGTVASPEFIYPAPDKESPMAMGDTFGVCWIDDDALRQWLSLGKTITEVHTICTPGQEEAVVTAMKALGERYGLRSWWTWTDQPSHRLMIQDLKGWQAMSLIFPVLFMSAAALSLFSSLSRVLQMQTGVIGFLRSSGLSRRAVQLHYIFEGGLLTACGAIPGMMLGHMLSMWMVGLYSTILKLPDVVTLPHPTVMASAVAMAMCVGVVAAWIPARRAAATPPAIAMRGDVSVDQAAPHDNWLMALTRYLPTLLRIPARGLIRRPSRTILAVCGLTSGTALQLMTLGMYVSIMDSIGEYLDRTVRYEIDGTFSSPHAEELVNSVSRLPGVTAASPSCMLPVRLHSPGGQEVSCIAYGLPEGQSVMGLPTDHHEPLPFRPGEVYLANFVARRLHVEPGDPLELEWAFSSRSRRVRTVLKVGPLMDITFGGFAIVEYHELRRSLVDRVYPEASFGCMIATSPQVGRELRRRLERDDMTININSMADLRQQIYDSLRITRIFVGIMVLFGAVLAGAVLQGVSSVGILERLRELATLRSLGFSARATTAVAALEVYLMATLGLLVGFPCGTLLNRGFMAVFESDVFTYRTNLPWWTYGLSALIVFILVGWSLRTGVRKLAAIDLAQATKARE